MTRMSVSETGYIYMLISDADFEIGATFIDSNTASVIDDSLASVSNEFHNEFYELVG